MEKELSKVSFDNYGKLAREVQDPTIMAGRYAIQAPAERSILPDVLEKLQIRPQDKLLDIGCNVGALLIPLSYLVHGVTGIDHPSCLEKLRLRTQGENIQLLGGAFLDLTIQEQFNKILCYSVLHYLSDEEEVLCFIFKALKLLAPGGIALFGDIPNQSKKQRFLDSESGKAFERQWKELVKKEVGDNNIKIELPPDPNMVQFSDELLLQICRSCRADGFEAYIYPQPSHLPFGNTREDIVITRPA